MLFGRKNCISWSVLVMYGNYSGIKNVYGHEALKKMNGCEFHYNQMYIDR